MSGERASVTVPAHHLVGMDLSFTCTNCGGHTSVTPPCIPAKTYPAPVPSGVAETTAGEREVEALAKAIGGIDGDDWSDLSDSARDSCTRASRAVLASPALAALLDRVRREEGKRIAQAIEGAIEAHRAHGHKQAVAAMAPLPDLARAASVGRGDA